MQTTNDMIQAFSTKKLSNALFGAFMEAFDKLVIETTLEKIGIATADYQEFKKQLDALIDANFVFRKNPLSQELADLDQIRDGLIRYFFDRVGVDKASPVEATANAAKGLADLVKSYNGIEKKSLREESHLINGFINDAKKTELLNQIKVLGLEPTIQRLEETNTKFEQTMATRAKQEEALTV